jgi:hypothetical protein
VATLLGDDASDAQELLFPSFDIVIADLVNE